MRLVILSEEDEKRLESIVARTGRTQTEVVSSALIFYEDALDAANRKPAKTTWEEFVKFTAPIMQTIHNF